MYLFSTSCLEIMLQFYGRFRLLWGLHSFVPERVVKHCFKSRLFVPNNRYEKHQDGFLPLKSESDNLAAWHGKYRFSTISKYLLHFSLHFAETIFPATLKCHLYLWLLLFKQRKSSWISRWCTSKIWQHV